MTSSKENLRRLQEQTGTTCFMLTPPHDRLNDLIKKALLLKTADDEAISNCIPFNFVIVLGPQYTKCSLSAEREMLIKQYLQIINNTSESIGEITTQEFLNECSSYLARKDFILVLDRPLSAL